MKRILLTLLIFANCTILFAQSSEAGLYKQRMIENINKGNFEKAAKEIKLVDDWKFDKNDSTNYVDINRVFDFSKYLDSIHFEPIRLKDFFLMFVSSECYALFSYYISKGDYANAKSYAEMSCLITKSVLGEDSPHYATSLGNFGVLYHTMGDYAKAETYFKDALRITKSVLGENHPDYVTSLYYLEMLYYDMGDYARAETYCLEALNIQKSILGENHPDYAASLNTIGLLYHKMGDYAKAEKYCLKALNIQKSILGVNHPDYAVSLNNLGTLYCDMGDYAKAEKYSLEALNIQKSALGENNFYYATSLNNLGLLYHTMGNYDRAETYYIDASRITKSILGENHPYYATSLNNLGALYGDMGDYAKAEKFSLDALNIQKSVLGENHPGFATSLHNLGALYEDMGDYTNAEKYCIESLRTIELVLGENHPYYARSLNGLGVLYEKMGDYTKAESCLRNAMSLDKKRFMQTIEFMTEEQRKLFWETLRNRFVYTYPVFTYYYSVAKPSISTFAYESELFAKGILLNSSESVKRSVIESGDTILIKKWDELKAEKQMIIALQEKDPQSTYITEHQERAEQLEKEITKSSAAYRESQAMWEITWDRVRNQLSSNQVAIEYMVAPLNEDSTMYCALLLRDTCSYPIMIPLFNEPVITSLINTTSENQTSYTYSYNGNGDQLSQLVWSKILPYVKPGETIYFAPSGILHQLAIEALPYDESNTMGDMFNLVRLSSTREIVTRKDELRQSSTATLYGGIQYNMDADELLTESEAYKATDILASRGIESDTLNRGTITYLKGTKAEAENINALLNQNNLQVQLFTAKNANEESFKALSGKHRNILHIATHGFYWSDSTAQKKDYFSQRMVMRLGNDAPAPPTIDPLNRCGLLFAGAQTAWSGHSAELPEGVQDGILTAKEISLLDLRDADLVVLSACETGKGEITGDGVFGLQRAFKQAGAQTIIMSLWPVNDAATQLLMTEFYRNWITNHQSKRKAFRNAQNTVRCKYEEPVYWAGFIMLD